MARAYEESCDYSNAKTYYETALKMGKNEKYEQKYKELNKCLDEYKSGAAAFSNKNKQSDFPTALKSFLKCAEMKPNDASIAYSLGRVYEELGEYQNAKQAFTKAGQLAPTNSKYSNKLLEINKKLNVEKTDQERKMKFSSN